MQTRAQTNTQKFGAFLPGVSLFGRSSSVDWLIYSILKRDTKAIAELLEGTFTPNGEKPYLSEGEQQQLKRYGLGNDSPLLLAIKLFDNMRTNLNPTTSATPAEVVVLLLGNLKKLTEYAAKNKLKNEPLEAITNYAAKLDPQVASLVNSVLLESRKISKETQGEERTKGPSYTAR